MWHDELSHLICWTKKSGGGEEMENKERGENREKLQLLSIISSDRTFGFHRSKRKSSST